MTKAEKLALANALENCINRERRLCDKYIELNPTDRERRERDKDFVILGIQSMYYEIKRQLGGGENVQR